MKTVSKLFTLQMRDFVKGLFVAFLTAFLSTLTISIEDMMWPTVNELKNCTLAGIAAGVAYLLKNFVTNSRDEILKPEPGRLNRMNT